MKTSKLLIIFCLFIFNTLASQVCSAGENLVQDPGFEKGGDEWQDFGATDVVKGHEKSGKFSLRTGPGAGGRAQEIAGVDADKDYSFSFSAKVSEEGSHASVGLAFKDANGNTIAGYSWQAEIQETNYQTYSYSVKSPPQFDHVTIYTWKDTGLFYLYVDDFSLEEK